MIVFNQTKCSLNATWIDTAVIVSPSLALDPDTEAALQGW